MGFVRGGTPTSKSEQYYEERFQEAEKRRNEADRDARIASVPVEQGGGVYLTNQFTRHADKAKAWIPLTYVTSAGEPIFLNGEPVICQADLIIGMDPNRPMELTLVLVCPRCTQQGQKHEQDCQMHLRQSHKRFDFVASMGPPTFVHMGKTYRSAGVITESESFACPDCGWRARIVQNQVRPD